MQGSILKLTRALLISVALLALPGLTAPASARSTADLLSDANIRLDGAAAADYAGYSVAGAGDVNGDGRDDVIVGAPYADNNGRSLRLGLRDLRARGLARPRSTWPTPTARRRAAA